MLLFDIGTLIFSSVLGGLLTICIFRRKNFQNLDETQRLGCFGLIFILSIISGIVMIIAHYYVAGIPEVIKLW
jgi:hypothetical protein